MKVTCAILFFLGLAAFAYAEDAGFFVPKAYYKLDAEGHKSNVHEINPQQANILRRLRRQVSASSSSSVYTGKGGQGYFEQHQAVGLQSRFSDDYDDEDDTPVGYAIHSSGVIDNGRVVNLKTRREKL